MPESPKTNHGGRRKGAGTKPKPEQDKKVQTNLHVSLWIWDIFLALVPKSGDRSLLIEKWIRAYVISGESDRLLSESPLAIEILNYLEANDAPEELVKELESLLVARASDEVRIESGVVEIPNGVDG